tara:strand:+ start:847 stop:1338 length:492 start_codon:yes stop_codon:yes gene_type:complete
LKAVEDYINSVLDEKRSEFGGKRVCPFAARELSTNKLMIVEVGEKNLIDLILNFRDSTYESAIFLLSEDLSDKETKDFQAFVNTLLRYSGMEGYKNICFNPNDKVSVDGYNPRSLSPGFMINIAKKEVLSKASKALKKTNYYDRLPEDYLKFLKVAIKQKEKK